MLKNWTTIFKSVKGGSDGLFKYLRYLNNDESPSHTTQGHRIINFGQEWQEVYQHMHFTVEQAQLNKRMNGRRGGGNYRKYGHSITINFPFDVSDDRLKSIGKKMLLQFFLELKKFGELDGFSQSDWEYYQKHMCFWNVHKKQKGSKTQFNYVLSEFVGNHKFDFSKKKYSFLMKNVSDRVLEDFGYRRSEYQVKEAKRGKRKKISEYKINQTLQRLNDYKDQIDVAVDDISLKVQKRIQVYLNRMEKAIAERDQEKFDKNRELIEKNLAKVMEDKAKIPKLTKPGKLAFDMSI